MEQPINPENMTPEQIQKIIAEQCIFCKISKGEIPAKKVYEDEKIVAFLDINPANLGHTLVVPRQHYAVLPQMPDGEVAYLFAAVKKIAAVAFEVTQAQGVNILQNNGAAAGQEVPHVHVHVIPRFQDDKVTIPWQAKKIDDSQMIDIQGKMHQILTGGQKAAQVPTLPQPQPAPQPPPQPAQAESPENIDLSKIQPPTEDASKKPKPKEKKIKMKPKRP